jgi:hypothetical protein
MTGAATGSTGGWSGVTRATLEIRLLPPLLGRGEINHLLLGRGEINHLCSRTLRCPICQFYAEKQKAEPKVNWKRDGF